MKNKVARQRIRTALYRNKLLLKNPLPLGMGSVKNNVEKALRMVLKDCIHSDEFFEDYWRTDILTINTCRNGRDVAWCVWDEDIESCRYIDTLEKLSKEEIEEQLV